MKKIYIDWNVAIALLISFAIGIGLVVASSMS